MTSASLDVYGSDTAPVTFHNPDFPDEITDPNWEGDRRNIIDHYKYWSNEAIREDLAAKALPVNVVAENWATDFNLATTLRNANAFGAKAFHIVGRRHWDRRGAVGAHNYTPVEHHADGAAFYRDLKDRGVTIITVDNIPGAVTLPEFTWPDGEIALIFGQESIGVSNDALDAADHVVMITQQGSVRSLNVAVTSGIILYDYASRCRSN